MWLMRGIHSIIQTSDSGTEDRYPEQTVVCVRHSALLLSEPLEVPVHAISKTFIDINWFVGQFGR